MLFNDNHDYSFTAISFPINVDELKRQLNYFSACYLLGGDEDLLLELLLEGAVEYIHKETGRYIEKGTVSFCIDDFSGGVLKILATPCVVDSIITTKGKTALEYTTKTYDKSIEVILNEEILKEDAVDLTITATVGYTKETIPKDLKVAVLVKAADLYDVERSNYSNVVKNNETIEKLIKNYLITHG